MKIKIRILFHTPKGERGIGRWIVGYTWFLGLFYNWKVLRYNFSHQEIWLPDEDGIFGGAIPIGKYRKDNAHQIIFYGECFSSTTRGHWKGVRFAPAREVIGKHPDRWRYIECEVDAERLEVAVAEAKRLVGAKYDYWAIILGFLNPIPVQDSKRWYCSEICNWFEFLCRIARKLFKRISPRREAYELAKVWGEPREV